MRSKLKKEEIGICQSLMSSGIPSTSTPEKSMVSSIGCQISAGCLTELSWLALPSSALLSQTVPLYSLLQILSRQPPLWVVLQERTLNASSPCTHLKKSKSNAAYSRDCILPRKPSGAAVLRWARRTSMLLRRTRRSRRSSTWTKWSSSWGRCRDSWKSAARRKSGSRLRKSSHSTRLTTRHGQRLKMSSRARSLHSRNLTRSSSWINHPLPWENRRHNPTPTISTLRIKCHPIKLALNLLLLNYRT